MVKILPKNYIVRKASKFNFTFRFPTDSHATLERRDSIFCGPGDIVKLVSKPPMTPSSASTQDSNLSTLTPAMASHDIPGVHGNVNSVAISSSALLGSAKKLRSTPVSGQKSFGKGNKTRILIIVHFSDAS